MYRIERKNGMVCGMKLVKENGKQHTEPWAKAEEIYVPVEAGRIRVLHHVPEAEEGAGEEPDSGKNGGIETEAQRPVVFLPGWGTVPEGFRDFFDEIDERLEYYYVETREKNSSILDRKAAKLDMDTMAEDIGAVLDYVGLAPAGQQASREKQGPRPEGGDFLLMGTCWGSTVIAHGLARGILSAPTVVLFEPMHRLWFPRWILDWIAPLTPSWLWTALKPLGKRIAFLGMKEEVQRRRAEHFVDNADLWKWRRAAIAVRDLDLYRSVGSIEQEVFVIDGVEDRIHAPGHAPGLAALIPKGRYFHIPADESQREHLLGTMARSFTGVFAADSPPASIADFETVAHEAVAHENTASERTK